MQRLLTIAGLLFSILAGCDTPSQPTAKPRVAAAEGGTTANGRKNGDQPVRVPKSRKFDFHYQFQVKDLTPSGDEEKDLVRVWLPCPSSSDQQEVVRLEGSAPAAISEQMEARFGNRLLYFETRIPSDGQFNVDVPYEVVRHEVLKAEPSGELADELDERMRDKLLEADTLVPTSGKALSMIDTIKLSQEPLALARQLYDVVDEHVVYKKEGTGWGRGDTNWVCESGYGNCTDFHSLFISLARSQGLPARFEIGFSIPTDKQEGPVVGYHCWAWFHLKKGGWIPVDISEADKHPELKDYYFGNLTADRVMFSAGRDLELVPEPVEGPLNFHIYPYIEVGGQTLAKENVELQFTFADK